MEVSFVSLLSCNQLGWWEEEEDTPPTLGHQELRVMWDGQCGEDTPPPTAPTLGHQQLRVKWDEHWWGGHPTHPPLVISSWESSEMTLSTSWIKYYTKVPAYWDPRGLAGLHWVVPCLQDHMPYLAESEWYAIAWVQMPLRLRQGQGLYCLPATNLHIGLYIWSWNLAFLCIFS